MTDWTGDIEVTGSHEHGYTIPAWVEGVTQARVVWQGWDGDDRTQAAAVHEKVYADPRELLQALGAIYAYVNLELVSVKLESRPAS